MYYIFVRLLSKFFGGLKQPVYIYSNTNSTLSEFELDCGHTTLNFRTSLPTSNTYSCLLKADTKSTSFSSLLVLLQATRSCNDYSYYAYKVLSRNSPSPPWESFHKVQN